MCAYLGVLVVVAAAGDLHADAAGDLLERAESGCRQLRGTSRWAKTLGGRDAGRAGEVARAGRIRTLRMPLDQMALLSLTSTRTSEVFMVFWANFFTCWSESAEGEGREVVSGSGTGWRTRAMGPVGDPTTEARGRADERVGATSTLGKHRWHHGASSSANARPARAPRGRRRASS